MSPGDHPAGGVMLIESVGQLLSGSLQLLPGFVGDEHKFCPLRVF